MLGFVLYLVHLYFQCLLECSFLKYLKEMNNKQPHIEETIDKLTELARSYQVALECANEIISMKNRYIELCKIETELHRKENLRLQKSIFWISICLGLSAIISLCRLFV